MIFDVELVGEVPERATCVRRVEPVTVAVPFPVAELATVESLGLTTAGNGHILAQVQCLDRWADGSVRWALVDFLADTSDHAARWILRPAGEGCADLECAVTIAEADGALVVDTGTTRFELGDESAFPFRDVQSRGSSVIDSKRSGLSVIGEGGVPWTCRNVRADVERAAPIRSVVRVQADLTAGRHRHMQLDLRLHFFAGSGTVRVELMLRNPNRARHRHGHWDLGDPGSILLREVIWRSAARAAGQLRASVEIGAAMEDVDGALQIRQGSSGGDNWRSATHVSADGRVHVPFRGYQGKVGDVEISGRRATPAVSLDSGDASVGLVVPRFWQNFPAAIEADQTKLDFSLFPDPSGLPHELQGGEQKTHVFYVTFGRGEATEGALEWCRSPLRVRCATDVYARAGVVPRSIGPRHSGADDYERLIAPALEGPSSFFEKRERVDEYGWRHFGDLFADHETVYSPDSNVVSHYNNQYDAIQAFAAHFMRTGDWRWWELADDLARHVVDIDLYHTTDDRSAYNGGLFCHTNHYVSAATATHRSYSRASGLPGGGPSNEHNYTTGLLTHYFLTGSRASAEAVAGLAHWVVAMDDGALSRFRYIDSSETGLASSTYSSDYHGPGRGAGNSINALLDGHRLTGEESLLAKAEALIRRCIHPDDDPESFDLLDAERRWSYVVFLQAIGRFLDYKLELRREDEMFAFARKALVHYALWMASYERPALDRPERLEFPNETWAAQELRKADVFHLASRYSPPEDRPRLLERRDWFFRYALDTLAAMPTAKCTRPLVLLLGQGIRVAYEQPEPASTEMILNVVAPREPFTPQKQRVFKRLRRSAVAAVGLTMVLVLVAVWLFARGGEAVP